MNQPDYSTVITRHPSFNQKHTPMRSKTSLHAAVVPLERPGKTQTAACVATLPFKENTQIPAIRPLETLRKRLQGKILWFSIVKDRA